MTDALRQANIFKLVPLAMQVERVGSTVTVDPPPVTTLFQAILYGNAPS